MREEIGSSADAKKRKKQEGREGEGGSMRDERRAIKCNDFNALDRECACFVKAHHYYSAKGKGG